MHRVVPEHDAAVSSCCGECRWLRGVETYVVDAVDVVDAVCCCAVAAEFEVGLTVVSSHVNWTVLCFFLLFSQILFNIKGNHLVLTLPQPDSPHSQQPSPPHSPQPKPAHQAQHPPPASDTPADSSPYAQSPSVFANPPNEHLPTQWR